MPSAKIYLLVKYGPDVILILPIPSWGRLFASCGRVVEGQWIRSEQGGEREERERERAGEVASLYRQMDSQTPTGAGMAGHPSAATDCLCVCFASSPSSVPTPPLLTSKPRGRVAVRTAPRDCGASMVVRLWARRQGTAECSTRRALLKRFRSGAHGAGRDVSRGAVRDASHPSPCGGSCLDT